MLEGFDSKRVAALYFFQIFDFKVQHLHVSSHTDLS